MCASVARLIRPRWLIIIVSTTISRCRRRREDKVRVINNYSDTPDAMSAICEVVGAGEKYAAHGKFCEACSKANHSRLSRRHADCPGYSRISIWIRYTGIDVMGNHRALHTVLSPIGNAEVV